jgi:hypothetical protein
MRNRARFAEGTVCIRGRMRDAPNPADRQTGTALSWRTCILTVNSLDSTTNLNRSRTLTRIGLWAGDVISALPCAYAATSVTYSAAFPECSCSS